MQEENYWTRVQRKRLSRRRLLSAGAVTAAGLAAAAAVGCEEEEAPSATTPPVTSPAATTPPAATPTASPTPVITRGGTVKAVMTGSPPTMDPDRSDNTNTKAVAVNVYSMLFQPAGRRAGAGARDFPVKEYVGDLASAMPEIVDPLTYIVKLRPNAKWQPPLSRPVSAEDVVYSVQRMQGKISGIAPAVYSGFYGHIDKAEATDASTVRFTLKNPHALFVPRFATEYNMMILPKEAGTAFDPAATAVGSGPFILKSFTRDVSASFVRNPEWHLGPDRPYVDAIDAAIVPAYTTRLTQFLAGNIDTVGGVPPKDLKEITTRLPNASVEGFYSGYLVGIGFQFRQADQPWSKDPRVRQAISLALDRDALFDALYSPKDVQAAGLTPPPLLWHSHIPVSYGAVWLDPKTDPKLKSYFEYNPTKAKALLAEAGYPNGFKVSYHYTGGYGPLWQLHAELMIPMLTAIGLNLDVKLEDFASTYYAKTFVGDFDGIGVFYHGLSEPGDVVEIAYASWGGRNYGKINDPQIDDMALKIQGELNFDKRVQLLKDAQYYLAEKMYFVPGMHDAGPAWTAWSPRLRGFEKQVQVRGNGGTLYPNLWIAT